MRKTRPEFKLTRQSLRIFWQHAKKYRWQVWTLGLGVVGVEVLQTYTPILYRDLINLISGGMSEEAFSGAVRLVLIILGVNIGRVVFWRLIEFVNNYFQPRVMSDLANTCYDHLQNHSYGFFTSRFVGSLVTKVKRYERSFEQIADQVSFDLGRSLLDMLMVMAVVLWQYPSLGIIILGWCIIFLLFSYFYSVWKLPYDIKRAAADTQTTAQLADSITNNLNVKLFTNQRLENKRFQNVTQGQFLARKKSWDLGTVGNIVQGFLSIALEFAIIYLALRMWFDGELGVGDIVLLQTYLLRLFDKLWNTGKHIRATYEALADANEMTEMLVQPHAVQDAPGARALKVDKGRIEYRGVRFGYHEEADVLQDFDLSIAPGERVALIGPSGGGKSTIVKLLFRFHDIHSGKILIDGQNIAKVTQNSLRKAMALVPQDPILFHRSLMDNIRYARPGASEKDVVRAAKLAHAHEFISSFSRGYDTLVGERGVKLSGGERQRVAIARAILKDPPILVLDEATSSLDSESEMYIQDALKELMRGRTTIVVAHRLSTIMQMDRIVVIDSGHIVEEGRHEELLKVKQGLYQKLWDIQAGGFTAA